MGAFTYPRSEPGSAGHQDLVERLNSLVPAVRREIDGLSEDALGRRPSGDEWSAREVLGHLCDHVYYLHLRLFRMINQEEPRLPAWNESEAHAARNAQAARTEELLAELTAKRLETVEMLAELVHWNWARQGRHEELGRLSIRQLVDRAIAHEDAHLEQLRQLNDQ